ncbi:uncharacterized mitochondrial protein-like protein [Tanacetum coccineum]
MNKAYRLLPRSSYDCWDTGIADWTAVCASTALLVRSAISVGFTSLHSLMIWDHKGAKGRLPIRANEPLRTKEALGSDVGHMYMLDHEVEKLHDDNDDDYKDQDYDVAALANNLTKAFRYGIYENDDNGETVNLCDTYYAKISYLVNCGYLVLRSPFARMCVSLDCISWFAYCKGTMAGVHVNTLTMEQYLALSRENQAPGVVKPEIGGNVNFEINSQFMRELREDTFYGNKDEDAHDHIDRVLSIIGLFNIPGVSKDAVML